MPEVLNIEQAVRERYATGAQQEEAALCCPVDYDQRFLALIPEEILAPRLRLRETLRSTSGPAKPCSISARARAKSVILPPRSLEPQAG